MEKIRVLFTGDSITDVYRTDVARVVEGWLPPTATAQERQAATDSLLGMGYPLLAAAQLSAEEPGRYEFLNRGISGNRVVDLDARVKRDCINLKPQVLSIMIGVNDVWHELMEQNGVDAEKFRRVYQAMLEEIAAALPGLRLILLEPYVLPGPSTQPQWDDFRREVDLRRAAVRDLAAHMERRTGRPVACIDTQSLLDDAAAREPPLPCTRRTGCTPPRQATGSWPRSGYAASGKGRPAKPQTPALPRRTGVPVQSN